MINNIGEAVYIINKDSIQLNPENNSLTIKNAFHPDGSPPDVIDVRIPQTDKIHAINIHKHHGQMSINGQDMTFTLSNRRDYVKFRGLFDPIMHDGATGITGYKNTDSAKKEIMELMQEITNEKNPGVNVGLNIVNSSSQNAYAWVNPDGDQIMFNTRRYDPKLKYRALQTIYHENEHITQFNMPTAQDYKRWLPLSTDKTKPFYLSPSNPIEEDARVVGNSFGRYNFRWISEYMRNADDTNWKDYEAYLPTMMRDFSITNFGRDDLSDVEEKIIWGHTQARETYPGRKTQRVLRDYIESVITKNLPDKYYNADTLQNMSYNILHGYIKYSNRFNRGENIVPQPSISLWSEAYAQNVPTKPELQRKYNIQDPRIYDDREQSLKDKVKNAWSGIFGNKNKTTNNTGISHTPRRASPIDSMPQDMLSKITNAMFHGGNRIKWR